MRAWVKAASCSIVLTVLLALSPAARAASAWDEIRGSVFGKAAIEDGRGVVTLSAPNRPDDMRVVPIGVSAAFKDGRTVKTITLLIDENPTPVVAVFHMGAGRDAVAINGNFRVDRQSDVRAVVEASDGKRYMVSQLIKFAGGQSSCSAPPQGDPAEIVANMGKMNLTQVTSAKGAASSALARAKVELNHPNHTGLVMDQITLLYTPMKMISEITVENADGLVFRAEGSIALSQNPMLDFDFKRGQATDMSVTMKDTDGGTWTRTFPIGPAS